jgi:hypothetical protein
MTIQRRVSLIMLALILFSTIGFVVFSSGYTDCIIGIHGIFAIILFFGFVYENDIMKALQIVVTCIVGVVIILFDHSAFYGYGALTVSLSLAIVYGWFNTHVKLRIFIMNILLYLILVLELRYITALQVILFFDAFIAILVIVFFDYFKVAFKNVKEYRQKWEAEIKQKDIQVAKMNKATNDALLVMNDVHRLLDQIKSEGINE